MKAGFTGTFVISWAQTEVDGVREPPLAMLAVGSAWRWNGASVRLDAPQDALLLEGAEGMEDLHQRAARMVRRLIRLKPRRPDWPEPAAEELFPDRSFVLTDGTRSYTAVLMPGPKPDCPLLMFIGTLPPERRDLWVVRVALERAAQAAPSGGVICFVPGTRIATPQGPRAIEDLAPGMQVLTKDNGPQQVVWTGCRRMSGARLFAMPALRPIRFRLGALGQGRPDADLLVSPQHRMLVRGPAAQALFNTDEVLVAAETLVNDRSVTVDYSLRDVTYVHVMLERHNIVWANGLETESFHPSNTALDSIEADQLAALCTVLPGVQANPEVYGDYARRNLSASEAAILRYDLRL